MLVLPTGQILFTDFSFVSVYNPAGTYDPAWAPVIQKVPTTVSPGGSSEISGHLFNGMSQRAADGDDSFRCAGDPGAWPQQARGRRQRDSFAARGHQRAVGREQSQQIGNPRSLRALPGPTGRKDLFLRRDRAARGSSPYSKYPVTSRMNWTLPELCVQRTVSASRLLGTTTALFARVCPAE
jgi:hypothetical protein